jgi:hypoxanthine phosphoribosyltransferase
VTTTSKKKAAPRSAAKGHGRRAARNAARPARAKETFRRPGEQPLGAGVADGFAASRLGIPARLTRAPKKAVREIGWAAFGEVARQLGARIAQRFRPDLVVGIAKGGVFVGGALGAALGADFVPVRIERRRRDTDPDPATLAELPDLRRKHVLVVDDVANTGMTLSKARALARKAGAREIRTAALVVRPGGFRPDWYAVETDALVLFGWDYQLDAAGGGPIDPGEVGV